MLRHRSKLVGSWQLLPSFLHWQLAAALFNRILLALENATILS